MFMSMQDFKKKFDAMNEMKWHSRKTIIEEGDNDKARTMIENLQSHDSKSNEGYNWSKKNGHQGVKVSSL